jgi:hypothetical protein
VAETIFSIISNCNYITKKKQLKSLVLPDFNGVARAEGCRLTPSHNFLTLEYKKIIVLDSF